MRAWPVRLRRTPDGWKVQSKLPAVLLAARARLVMDLPKDEAEESAALGLASYTLKRWNESAKHYERAATLSKKEFEHAYNAACSWALAGNADEAVTWLQNSVERGYADLAHISKDPDLTSIRKDARYEAIVRKLSSQAKPRKP